jgi:hypothetical protein
MSRSNHDAELFGRDMRFEEEDTPGGPAEPLSQAEIEELLYNDGLAAADRLARLKQLRADLEARQADDFGDNDPKSLLTEIDSAILRLEDPARVGATETSFDSDPANHRETLSPDDDLLAELEEETDEDDLAVLDSDLDTPLDVIEGESDRDGGPAKDVHLFRVR